MASSTEPEEKSQTNEDRSGFQLSVSVSLPDRMNFPDLAFASLMDGINAWVDSLTPNLNYRDPVFDGMVRDFLLTDKVFRSVLKSVNQLVRGMVDFCEGLEVVSDVVLNNIAKITDAQIASDCCKFREASCAVGHLDAPHSIISKFKRDLKYNVTGPLTDHIAHNRQLKNQLKLRQKLLEDMILAENALRIATENKSPYEMQAKTELETAIQAFEEVDRPLFEWLLMIEEYKSDFFDSLIQTLKYLQYEFFAGSAHCISSVLPTRMEFRPLLEMTPSELKPLVQMELDEALKSEKSGSTNERDKANFNATSKLLSRWQNSINEAPRTAEVEKTNEQPVDKLSLSILTSQGFKETQCRQALRAHNNDMQAALDCLLEGHVHSQPVQYSKYSYAQTSADDLKQQVSSSLRLPSTLKWVKKLNAYRAKHKRREGTEEQPSSTSNLESCEANSVELPDSKVSELSQAKTIDSERNNNLLEFSGKETSADLLSLSNSTNEINRSAYSRLVQIEPDKELTSVDEVNKVVSTNLLSSLPLIL